MELAVLYFVSGVYTWSHIDDILLSIFVSYLMFFVLYDLRFVVG
mgnify:CR=1 FL=1